MSEAAADAVTRMSREEMEQRLITCSIFLARVVKTLEIPDPTKDNPLDLGEVADHLDAMVKALRTQNNSLHGTFKTLHQRIEELEKDIATRKIRFAPRRPRIPRVKR